MAHVPPFPESLATDTAKSLALQACDDVGSLHAVHRALACIEKFIVPQRVGDPEDACPSRTELGALMELVNEELQRRIEAAEATVRSLRLAVSEGGAR